MPFDFFWGEGGEGGVDGEGEAAKDEGEQVKADLHRGEGEEGIGVEAQPAAELGI